MIYFALVVVEETRRTWHGILAMARGILVR
jgi:hypothetical protein